MQYQKILLLLNITILAIIYFFCKDKPKRLRLLVSTTLYAYILAIPLPYLLLWIPLKWIMLFYAAAVGLSLIIIDTILSNFEDIKLEKAADKVDNRYPNKNKSRDNLEPEELLLGVNNSTLVGSKDIVMEEVARTIPIDTNFKPEEIEEIVLSELDTAGAEAAAVQENDAGSAPIDTNFKPEEIEEIVLSELDTAGAEAAAVQENDAGSAPIDTNFKPEEIEEIVLSELDTAETEATAVLDSMEVSESSIESSDIDLLIDRAFDAKCKDDYIAAIKIFEQILRQRPAKAIIELINEDIEVMLKKIS